MFEPILAAIGLGLLAVLCLPFSGFQKLVLEVYGLALRLSLLALLAGAAVLCFRPDLLPVEVENVLSDFPHVRALLPATSSPFFGATIAASLAVVLLPWLAVIDVSRKLAGRRLRRLKLLTREAHIETLPAAAEPPAQRRVDRRAAADALAQAGSRKPYRVADHVS